MKHINFSSRNLFLVTLLLTLTLLALFVYIGQGQSESSDVCNSPVCERCKNLSNEDCIKCVKFDMLDSHEHSWYPHTIDGIKVKKPLFKTDSGTSTTCTIDDPEEDECELIEFEWDSDITGYDPVPIDCLYIKTGWGPHHIHGSYDSKYYFEYDNDDPDRFGDTIAPPEEDNSAISHITFCYDITADVSHNPSTFNITQSKLEDHLGEQYLPLGSLELSVTGDSVENADCKYQYDNNCLQSNALYLTEENILDPTNCTSSSVCGYLYLEGLNNQPTEILTDIPEGTYNTFIDLNKVADEGAPASCNITIKAEIDSCP